MDAARLDPSSHDHRHGGPRGCDYISFISFIAAWLESHSRPNVPSPRNHGPVGASQHPDGRGIRGKVRLCEVGIALEPSDVARRFSNMLLSGILIGAVAGGGNFRHYLRWAGRKMPQDSASACRGGTLLGAVSSRGRFRHLKSDASPSRGETARSAGRGAPGPHPAALLV